MQKRLQNILLSAAFTFALLGLSACAGNNGVAATVYDQSIMESEVTDQIQRLRSANGLLDDSSWANALQSAGLTPSAMRDEAINGLAERIIIKHEAQNYGLTINATAVNAELSNMKRTYGFDTASNAWSSSEKEAEYKAALGQFGYENEQKLADEIGLNDLREQLRENPNVIKTPDPSATDLQEYAHSASDSRKSSALIFTYSSEAGSQEGALSSANEAIAFLKAGNNFTQAFAKYCREIPTAYSLLTASVGQPLDDSGNMGWLITNRQTDEYAAALNALPLNEISQPVSSVLNSETGASAYFVIQNTEIWHAPVELKSAADVDLATIPADLVAAWKIALTSDARQTEFTDWIATARENANIKINSMPKGLPYDVDVSSSSTTSNNTSGSGSAQQQNNASSYSSPDAVAAAIKAGLQINNGKIGEGEEAFDGDTVSVRYTGKLANGTVFYSNLDRAPYNLTLGDPNGAIPGFQAGIVGMKVGGTRTLIIPPELAYGSTAMAAIPANSTLTFTIELLDVLHAE